MNIGPLISPSPLVPFANGFMTAINDAGVAWGDCLKIPSGISGDATIAYTSGEVVYMPLVSVFGLKDDARSVYENTFNLVSPAMSAHLGVEPARLRNNAFLSFARPVDYALAMRRDEVSDVLGELAFTEEYTSDEMEGMLSKLDFLGGGSVRRFLQGRELELVKFDNSVLIDASGVFKAIAKKGYELGALSADQAAAFHFVSGVLCWGAGLGNVTRHAVESFLESAERFAESGNPVAAAIAAEAGAYLHHVAGEEEHKAGSEAFAKASAHWLAVSEMMSSDPVGMLVALWRGIIADFMRIDDLGDEMGRRLFARSSAFHSEFERHAQAGADHLRVAMAVLMKSSADKASWERLSYSLQMAIGSYRRAGGHEVLLEQLEGLDALAKGEAQALMEEIRIIREESGEEVDVAVETWRWAMAKFRHGDFAGALRDLFQVEGWLPDHPYVLSDIGLVYHNHANYLSAIGNDADAKESLKDAEHYLERAIESSKINEVDDVSILHARLGALRATKGDYDSAIGELEAALEVAERKQDIRRYLAAVRRAMDWPARKPPIRRNGLRLITND